VFKGEVSDLLEQVRDSPPRPRHVQRRSARRVGVSYADPLRDRIAAAVTGRRLRRWPFGYRTASGPSRLAWISDTIERASTSRPETVDGETSSSLWTSSDVVALT